MTILNMPARLALLTLLALGTAPALANTAEFTGVDSSPGPGGSGSSPSDDGPDEIAPSPEPVTLDPGALPAGTSYFDPGGQSSGSGGGAIASDESGGIIWNRSADCPGGRMEVTFEMDSDGHPIPTSFERTCVPFQ